MYTYERLCILSRENTNDSDVAHYLLKHINNLSSLKISTILKEIGISRASFHRFYHKGGYQSFNDLITTLMEEVKQKNEDIISYEQYKSNVDLYYDHIEFDEQQLLLLVSKLKDASKVVFYGNFYEISCFGKLVYLLFSYGIDVIYLDNWNINEAYDMIDTLEENDVFIVVETSWRIQNFYENSIITPHIINLDALNDCLFSKFFIGEANSSHYYAYNNIQISYEYENLSIIALNHLDEKIASLFGGTYE